jgi:hypothetical protein
MTLILYLESRLKKFEEATYDPADYVWKVAYDSEMFGKPPMTLKLYSEPPMTLKFSESRE